MRGSSSRTESRSHIRGRGSRGFSGRHRGWRTEAPKGQALGGRTDQTGELLRTITLSKIQSSPQFKDITPTIENCEYVASYNWLNKKRPTILVPGTPPAWTPPNVIPKLRQDSGDYFRDVNAASWPRFPVEPAIRAVFTVRPDFEGNDIDVVACGNTMGNLLRFAKSKEMSFEFNVEVIGKTVFLVRMGNPPQELIPDVRGYGHTFPEAYTSWDKDLQGSVSHQRVIKYRFGEIKCMLRFESDGYLNEKAGSGGNSSAQAKSLPSSAETEISSLLLKTKSTFVSEEIPAPMAHLTVELSGRNVPQNAIFDLKTRSAHKEIDMEEIYPRLWISQIPNFIIAYHNAGDFKDIQCQDVQDELKSWETNNGQHLRILYKILHQLISVVKQAKGHQIGVRRTERGPLEIRKLPKGCWSALPNDLKSKWTGLTTTEHKSEASSSAPERETGDDSFDDEEAEEVDDYLKF